MRKSMICLLCSAALTLPSAAWAQASPSPFTSGTRYDGMGRMTGTIAPDPDGAGPLHYAAVRISYDAGGRRVKVEKGELAAWQSDAVTPASWTGFTIHRVSETEYDAIGRKMKDVVKEGPSAGGATYAVTQYSYNTMGALECTAVRMNPAIFAALPSSACTLGTEGSQGPDRITRNLYDAAGQLVQTRKAVGSSLEQAYVTYGYTANSQQEYVIDANGNKARRIFDGFDRQTQWQFPSATLPSAYNPSTPANALATAGSVNTNDREEYVYDANDNRTSLRKRDGQVIAYTYDALNRVMVKDIPGGTSADVYYGYDVRGFQTYARFGSSSGTGLTNVYDGFGHQISASTNMNGSATTFTYQWDADGNRTRMTYPTGLYFTYEYDGLDRIVGIKNNGATTIVAGTYDAQGRRASQTRGAVTTNYSYDTVSRLTGLADDLSGSASDITTAFAYNPAGQIVSRQRSNDLYRFTGYPVGGVNRTYAANGLNQYSNVGGNNYSYDANGNLTNDGSDTYAYDVENRLVSKTVAGGTASLQYDPLGRLWRLAIPGRNIDFLYDGDAMVSEVSDGTYRYVHGNNDDDPLVWYDNAAATADHLRSYQIDHQGSIVSSADPSGVALAVDSYDEYGIYATTNPAIHRRFAYTGQMLLGELGLYNYKARIYSPTLGRFLQTDPIGYADQNNLYAYVGNDPVNGRDPSGMTDVAADCASRSTCHVDVQQSVAIVHQKDGKTVVDSVVSVTMHFSKSTDSRGNVSWAVSASVANVSGKVYSEGQLATMGNSVAATQKEAIGRGFGEKTTQMVTAIGATETALGANSAPGAPAFKAGNINPMQLSGGRANMNLGDNVRGAMNVVEWAGRPSNFDPTSTYKRYSDGGTNTMANWGGVYGSIRELKSYPW